MLRVISDTHLGCVRASGTTQASQLALSLALREQVRSLLPDSDLMVLGDLFDKSQVSLGTLLETFIDLSEWLAKGFHLYIVSGNHDEEKTSGKLSSFDILCALLVREYPTTVTVVKGAGMDIPYGYVIPHMANQDLFNEELKAVPTSKFLFLHVNYDNFFAAQTDQSLNISKEQVQAAPVETIIIGHEHNFKQEGKVLLPGSQTCTSVGDWAGSQGKFLVEVEIEGGWMVRQVQDRNSSFIELQWDNLVPTEAKFVRVVGVATTEQASQVVSLIAKFRAESSAFVISNAVQIASESGTAAFSDSLEGVRAFDVWNALGDHLDDSQIQALKELK